ncbi:MAG TPA: glycogen/starch/alpha-glucan phosphorylase [Thermoanaerobaculia bacterium]|nr:glycogen/starch/alpha-glucan phosphorylase [Thermoanaerobaculia bacterium]
MSSSFARQETSVPEGLTAPILHHARYGLALPPGPLTPQQVLTATALAVRDRTVEGMLATEERYRRADAKRLYYLSMEFLVGRSLENNLQNLGLLAEAREALEELGGNLEEVLATEHDAALGNGGLGRLAACFLDSLASLDMPGFGYGIHYEYGLFRQVIDNCSQREQPDNWLSYGSPWEIEQPDEACVVPAYGYIEHAEDREGSYNPLWLGWRVLVGVPYDLPIVGYGGRTVNWLRLFAARSSDEFDIEIFNEGDYLRAVSQKMESETVSKVLYPSDAVAAGRELRLLQEYFLVACAIRDIFRRYERRPGADFQDFAARVAIQLNDTHPSLTVLELMRILVDEKRMAWEEAWETVGAACGYTNHTLMPEALERWPVPLFERVLPRHLQILYEINHRFLSEVGRRFPGDVDRLRRMSLIEESEPRQVRMAHLAIVGSHSVNGVATLHSELVKSSLVPDFHALWPERFNNKTNGVTPRRWLLTANPALAALLDDALGSGWAADLERLRPLAKLADDAAFRVDFAGVKQQNKARLARQIAETTRIAVDPATLFDVQVKRIHEYKRQLLNALHIVHQYLSICEDGITPPVAKTYIFAGKAAPGYWAAKQVIYLINRIAAVINADPRARDWLRVVFIPDYRVSLAEVIIPAGEISEQISTAGTEASGTSNMKFAMNGALTLGTLDGANVEIRDEVGAENVFLFGLTVEEIAARRQQGYRPAEVYAADPDLKRVLDTLAGDRFGEGGTFAWVREKLVEGGDPYFLLADFASYREVHERAAREYLDPARWWRKAIWNVAHTGRFSSDRTIRQYAAEIWGLRSVPEDVP